MERMSDEPRLGIGAFSLLTGLSIPALRHYDEVGLLLPAAVNGATGYRRYDREQVATGRLIRALRGVDLPIDEIRAVVAADDAATMRAALQAHRSRLVQQQRSLAGVIEMVDDYIENGVRMKDTLACRVAEINLGVNDLEAARKFYEAVFGLEFSEERHGDGPVHLFATFGSWPGDEFFLLNLSAATRDPYRAGRADYGFLVGDLEAFHERATAAGGVELSPPSDVEGMPRTSAIADPSGNVINLYQNA
jgi:DNA-binding transcriptional MerR regulator